MKILAINGSPRKNGNTVKLIEKALDGAASQGAETELIHIYDLDFKGCTGCLACKLTGGKSYGKCAQRDELTPVLEKVSNVDAFILGSPIYFTSMTGEMRSCFERAAYPYLPVDNQYTSQFPRKIKTGLILTIGADEKLIKDYGMNKHFELMEMEMSHIFGSAESLIITGTAPYDDYTKYAFSHDGAEESKQLREEMFPIHCQKAFDMGVRLAIK